jgi:hypothetical protein
MELAIAARWLRHTNGPRRRENQLGEFREHNLPRRRGDQRVVVVNQGRRRALCFRGRSQRVHKGVAQRPRPEDKMEYLILFALTVLIADVWSIVNVIHSTADTGRKVLWTISVIIVPVLGFVLWYFLGPKTAGKG